MKISPVSDALRTFFRWASAGLFFLAIANPAVAGGGTSGGKGGDSIACAKRQFQALGSEIEKNHVLRDDPAFRDEALERLRGNCNIREGLARCLVAQAWTSGNWEFSENLRLCRKADFEYFDPNLN